ncbi:MAG: F420-0--gamma-glutamyl ligase [Clostridia bacterium]|nr:F420-0--gamma-glutamyl ligase [Clostridia bacterium]
MGFRNSEETKREKNGIVYFVRKSINTGGSEFERFAIQTHFVKQGESYLELINKYVVPFYEKGDVLSISEKIISMCQNNTVSKKDVKLGFWAKFLSKFASSNSRGIAMDEPYKLQLAINLAGLPRILFASFCSAVTKLFGMKGVFYKIAGNDIDGIDGFYMHSSFDVYHDIALLNPKNPDKVCAEIENAFQIQCMIVDANDFGVNILGKSKGIESLSDEFLISLVKDNPAGQSDELTPIILIKNVASNS